MSLLEDIFLEDETEEARALERVIEGDEYEDLEVRSDEERNSAEEAEEDKRRIDPSKEKTKRIIKNPRFLLNPARLTGPRGIQVIPEHFKDFKFKGKGHEKEDLDIVLKRLEHWAYRLYPKFKFEDCLKKIETLGKKRPVMVHLHKIRSDQISSDDPVIQKDSSDEEANVPEEDEFDKLLQQQIDIARSTPAPKKNEISTENTSAPLSVPRATPSSAMSNEQRERMIKNRQLALERRLARMKQNNNDSNQSQESIAQNSNFRNEDENNINIQSPNIVNSQTNNHIANLKDSSCGEIPLNDKDNEINSSQRDLTGDKENANCDKELDNLNNKCIDSDIGVLPVHGLATDTGDYIINSFYNNHDEYNINNMQIAFTETDNNMNENEVNVPNKVFSTQIVPVVVHQAESKSNEMQKSKADDEFINNHDRLNDSRLNSNNGSNSKDNGHDSTVMNHDTSVYESNSMKSNDVEMINDKDLSDSLQNSVTEVTEPIQIVDTLTDNMNID